MLTEPEVVARPAQPYVAIVAHVTMRTLGEILPPLHPQVSAWLHERSMAPAGPPFWKYNVVDMERELEVEVGLPVAAPLDGSSEVFGGVLPAGQYVTARYTGHPDGPAGATAALLAWAEKHHLTWDMTPTPDGDRWGARLEIYETDPSIEPDMSKWTTQLAFRLAD